MSNIMSYTYENWFTAGFMKAFDKVPHERPLHKIHQYGITGNVLGCIKSFLTNRTQQVCIKNTLSDKAPVTSGIPQGSVIGPLLFVIHINDLPNVVDGETFVYLFADDTKVFRDIKSVQDSTKKMVWPMAPQIPSREVCKHDNL